MKKNVIASTLSGSSKIFLLVCLASAFAADLAVFVMLLIQDVSVSYWIFPLLFLLSDALFIAQAAFSNFRFVYTVWQIVIWCTLTAVMLICTVTLNIGGDLKVFTDTAAALLIALHSVALLAVITSYLYASRRFSVSKTAQTAIAVLASVISVALAAFYGVFLGFGGFFGQGGLDVSPVTYIYDEESGGYEAVGVAGTKGGIVIVPEEFNGEKVTKISAGLFFETGVENVYLECSPEVEITNEDEIAVNEKLTVYTSKEHIDTFKNKFYGIAAARAEKSDMVTPALALANATIPYDMEGDEVYVTFSYDYNSFVSAGYKPLPTWFGKKGESVDLSYFKDIPYVAHSDRLSDDDLYWCYNNTEDRVILSDFTVKGESLKRSADADERVLGKVDGGVTAKVSFERVYRIFPGESNDTLRSAETDFTFAKIGGQEVNCKYTTAKNADKILAPYARGGFSLGWSYKESASAYSKVTFVSLTDALNSFSGSELYINPVWTMNAPKVSLKTNYKNDTAIYGDRVEFTAEADPASSEFELEYEWNYSFAEDLQCSGSTYSIDMVRRSMAGDYSVKVISSSPSSSLTSYARDNLNLTVYKRPLEVEWSMPEGTLVYDKTEKVVTCAIKDGEVLTFGGEKDEVSIFSDTFTQKNAGTYELQISLGGRHSENYYIPDGEEARTLTINKAPLAVTVTADDKYYDGQYVELIKSATGYVDDYDKEHVFLYAKGSECTAGTYQTDANLGGNTLDQNYYIDLANSKFAEYTIRKQPLELTYTIAGGDGFTYDGEFHYITVTGIGTQGKLKDAVCNGYVSSWPESLKNAGENQTVTAHILNGNFEVIPSSQTHTFTIKPYTVTDIERRNPGIAVVYDGFERTPDYVIKGVGRDKDSIITVSGRGGMHAGPNTFIPQTIESSYAGNYVLKEGWDYNLTYEITPASVYISWKNQTYTYDGKAHMPEAEAYGNYRDGYLKFELTREGDGINFGSYKVTAKLLNSDKADGYLASDYRIVSGETAYMSIRKAQLTVTANSFTVKAGEKFTLTYTLSGLVNGETEESIGFTTTLIVAGHPGATSISEAGVYDIQTTLTSAALSNNYEIRLVFGRLTVTA